jgi:hypothetical protein
MKIGMDEAYVYRSRSITPLNELTVGYFQQDGATCHTSNASMRKIESYFDNRFISKNLWPPRSPYLTPPDFFLWGFTEGPCMQQQAANN